MELNATVLIVEDGDEYLEHLTRYVPGPRYVQAHNAREAADRLREGGVDLVYLDMRFDRIPRTDLAGDLDAALRDHNGDTVAAWRYLANHQGLYVLHHLKDAGFAHIPVILAYDFSREPRRLEHLRQLYPNLTWVPDAVSPAEILDLMIRALAQG